MRTRHFFLGKFRGVKTGRAPARADSVPLYGVPNFACQRKIKGNRRRPRIFKDLSDRVLVVWTQAWDAI